MFKYTESLKYSYTYFVYNHLSPFLACSLLFPRPLTSPLALNVIPTGSSGSISPSSIWYLFQKPLDRSSGILCTRPYQISLSALMVCVMSWPKSILQQTSLFLTLSSLYTSHDRLQKSISSAFNPFSFLCWFSGFEPQVTILSTIAKYIISFVSSVILSFHTIELRWPIAKLVPSFDMDTPKYQRSLKLFITLESITKPLLSKPMPSCSDFPKLISISQSSFSSCGFRITQFL